VPTVDERSPPFLGKKGSNSRKGEASVCSKKKRQSLGSNQRVPFFIFEKKKRKRGLGIFRRGKSSFQGIQGRESQRG